MYKAKISEGTEFKIEVANNEYSVNGDSVQFDCQPIGDDKFHIIIDNQSMNAELVRMNKAKSSFVFLINNKEVELELEDKYDMLLDQLGMEKGAGAIVKNIPAPMPGLVLQVNVEVGQEVDEGQPLLVLEAMKMENVIKAPKAVTVTSIDIEVGQKVDKGQILVSF